MTWSRWATGRNEPLAALPLDRSAQIDVRRHRAYPVAQRPGTRVEGDLWPGDVGRREVLDVDRLEPRPPLATDDARLPGCHHNGCLRPRVDAHDPRRLDNQSGLLDGLADGALERGLVD